MVCAADTFRAAAVEQLTVWAGRAGVTWCARSPVRIRRR
jgi:signal recognition particle GTPase